MNKNRPPHCKFLMQRPRQESLCCLQATVEKKKKKLQKLQPLVNGKTIIIKREAELMDPIKANTKSPEAQQHKQSKVNSVIPQVSLTRTQFKETSIWDVSSQLMKLQAINIQDTTTTVNEVLMLVEISPYELSTKKFHLNWVGQLQRSHVKYDRLVKFLAVPIKAA